MTHPARRARASRFLQAARARESFSLLVAARTAIRRRSRVNNGSGSDTDGYGYSAPRGTGAPAPWQRGVPANRERPPLQGGVVATADEQRASPSPRLPFWQRRVRVEHAGAADEQGGGAFLAPRRSSSGGKLGRFGAGGNESQLAPPRSPADDRGESPRAALTDRADGSDDAGGSSGVAVGLADIEGMCRAAFPALFRRFCESDGGPYARGGATHRCPAVTVIKALDAAGMDEDEAASLLQQIYFWR